MSRTHEEVPSLRESRPQSPLVTVVVAAYNVAAYIGETLESIVSQTFKDYETIVINDGSEDKEQLEQVLDRYREHVLYIAQDNQGVAVARNRGIRAARGSYIAFLDADDLWLPNYLKEQVAFIQNGGYDLVYSDALLFGDSPLAGRTFMETAPSKGPVTFRSLIRGECCVITSGVVARRDSLIAAGLFDQQLRNSQDFDLWLRMVRQGARLAYQRKVLLKYRFREGSLSGDTARRIVRELHVLDKLESSHNLTPAERGEVSRAKRKVWANLNLEQAKSHLAQGQFREARGALEKANKELRSWKLRAVLLSLRVAPRFLARFTKSRSAGEDATSN